MTPSDNGHSADPFALEHLIHELEHDDTGIAYRITTDEWMREELRARYPDMRARVLIDATLRAAKLYPPDAWEAIFAPEEVPKKPPPAPVTRRLARAQRQANPPSPDASQGLAILQQYWSAAITGAWRTGTDPQEWYLILAESQDWYLGTTRQIMEQTHVRSRVFEATGAMMPHIVQARIDEWYACLEALATIAVHRDEPESHPVVQIQQLLLAYLTSRNVSFTTDFDEEEWKLCAQRSWPFRRDGSLYIHCRTWHTDYLHLMTDLTYQDAVRMLRRIGGQNELLQLRNPRTNRSYWKIPLESIYQQDTPF